MTNKKIDELHPNEIVRFKDGRIYFGLQKSALSEKIRSGEIPTPMDLSGNGRAVGWTGAQIIEYQRGLLLKAAQRATNRAKAAEASRMQAGPDEAATTKQTSRQGLRKGQPARGRAPAACLIPAGWACRMGVRHGRRA